MDGGVTLDWLVVVVDLPGASIAPIVGPWEHLGVSVLEATGDEMSPLATSATAFVFDETDSLLRAQTGDLDGQDYVGNTQGPAVRGHRMRCRSPRRRR